jgi:hypothetical protein
VARLEAIRILLAFATHHNFKIHQMDVKSSFLNGPISEEVYVEQPLGFEDPQFPTTTTSSIRRSMGSSKPHEHGMIALRNFS